MKKLVLTLGALSILAAAQAATAMTEVEDTDGNGTYSYEELLVAFPGLTEESFADADADGNGELSAGELAAAEEAGDIAN